MMPAIRNRRRRRSTDAVTVPPPGRRWRRGSVLILVVGLVVVLAVLGTAFITTSRVDRGGQAVPTAAAPLAAAQQAEVSGALVADLYADALTKQSYRQVTVDGAYQPWVANRLRIITNPATDPKATTVATFLADRLPTLIPVPGAAVTPTSATIPAWRSVTELRNPPGPFVNLLDNTTVAYESDVTRRPKQLLVPTSLTLTYPRTDNESPARTPRVVPAFRLYTQQNGAGGTTLSPFEATGAGAGTLGASFPAADADGDGVADALLMDLHVTTPSAGGDLHYYAGVRVIDNNSAVNANTAWSRYADFDLGTAPANEQLVPFQYGRGKHVDAVGVPLPAAAPQVGAGNLGWFPSHVGLLELLDPNNSAGIAAMHGLNPNEMDRLNQSRFNTAAVVSATPTADATVAGPPVATNYTTRADFNFQTAGEALFMQLGRRLDNPGPLNTAGDPFATVDDNNGDLARQFGLINGAANAAADVSPLYAGATNTNVERRLVRSAYMDALNWVAEANNRFALYPPDKANYWYDFTFNTAGDATMAPVLDPDPTTLVPGAGTYQYLSNTAGVAPSLARSIRPLLTVNNPVSNAITVHDYDLMTTPPPAVRPSVPLPPPTGTVLANDTPYMAPYPVAPIVPVRASVNTAIFPVLWTAFWNVMCDDVNPKVPNTNAAVKTFQPVSAALGTGRDGQLLVRAAVAAANVEALRTGPFADVRSHYVVIPATKLTGATADVGVEVFGQKPQPYIYSWDATTRQLTLCNPSPHAIDVPTNIAAGTFHLIAKVGTSYSDLGPILTANLPGPGAIGTVITVPPTPAPAGAADDNLLFVMRTRSSTGVAAKVTATTASDQYDETSRYQDWVPLDQVSLTPPAVPPVIPYTRVGLVSPNLWTAVMARDGGSPKPVQLWNAGFPGPYTPNPTPLTPKAAGNQFPYGTFGRQGDLLKIPFVGSYTLYSATSGAPNRATAAAVAVSLPADLDAAYAGVTSNGTPVTVAEEPGRFCPVDCDPANPVTLPATAVQFEWTKRIFEYFSTIQNPNDDFTPNISTMTNYPGAAPVGVINAGGTAANTDKEKAIGVQGLININTAPWQVLATLPMVRAGHHIPTTADDEDNVALAKAIVYFRDYEDGLASNHPHGPFRSIWELNQVVDTRPTAIGGRGITYTFQNRFSPSEFNPQTTLTIPGDGDFSPSPLAKGGTVVPDGVAGGVPGDFEKRFLTLTNISNLITVRSDTFTCYVVVQAWRNVGQGTGANAVAPELVDQKRVVFEVDRSGTGPSSTAAVVRQIAN